MAAMTVKVARMVGLPTSSTASMATFNLATALVFIEVEMAHDVFHHHDGVVHQDADGKNQGKKGDAVEGIAVQIKDSHSQGQSDRDGEGHYAGFPVPQGKPDEDGNRYDGDEHVKQQFVGFFLGCFAVMPGDGDVDIVGNDRAAGILKALQHLVGHS